MDPSRRGKRVRRPTPERGDQRDRRRVIKGVRGDQKIQGDRTGQEPIRGDRRGQEPIRLRWRSKGSGADSSSVPDPFSRPRVCNARARRRGSGRGARSRRGASVGPDRSGVAQAEFLEGSRREQIELELGQCFRRQCLNLLLDLERQRAEITRPPGPPRGSGKCGTAVRSAVGSNCSRSSPALLRAARGRVGALSPTAARVGATHQGKT
jgi:hypothetical protein